jgi:hypothetical protein
MAQRPYIRQGSALAHQLRSATKTWQGFQTFLNNLTDNGTELEHEARFTEHVKLRDEINTAAQDIYNALKDYKKRAFSLDDDLKYLGLAR